MKATKFRPQRRTLEESMAECVDVKTPDELRAAILSHCWGTISGLKIEKYGTDSYDRRIGWNTYIVTVQHGDKYGGVVGFTNGEADEVQFGKVEH